MKETLEELQKTEIEESVLSAFLYDNRLLFEEDFNASHFTYDRILIFTAIHKVIKSGNKADLVTVGNELRKSDVTMSYLAGLLDVPISHNLEYHVAELEKARLLRSMYRAYGAGIQKCKEGIDPFEIMSEINNLVVARENRSMVQLNEISDSVADNFEKKILGKMPSGLKTGLFKFDNVTGGFMDELILIAARPGMGKTALAMNLARNWGFMGKPGLIISLEMSKETLLNRMVCDVGSIDNRFVFREDGRYLKTKKEKQELIEKYNDSMAQVHDMPIAIVDSSNLTIEKIYSIAKRDKLSRNIEWIIIDYIGLIKGWNQPGQEPKAEISRQLLSIKRELGIPVVALSQMNRAIENRENKKPKLSDLRDTGCLEQDADIIIFPYVENKEEITVDEQYHAADLFVEKNRKGRTGKVSGFKWQGHYYRYSEGDKI